MPTGSDLIATATAVTLDGLFAERVQRSPERVAYTEFDDSSGAWRDYTWTEMSALVAHWQRALQHEALPAGARVAIMMKNSVAWIACDQAALGLGLVVVPLYTQDRADNVAYILEDSGTQVLVLEKVEQWHAFDDVAAQLKGLQRIVCCEGTDATIGDARFIAAAKWLEQPAAPPAVEHRNRDGSVLASIIYTSGTTGRPKGVMLSHHNMLANANSTLRVVHAVPDDTFLSFLPLSHTLERTCGYYLTMMAGARVAFARSIALLSEDLLTLRPTVLISVPRIYERVYTAIRAKLAEGPAVRRALFELAVSIGWARFEHAQGRAGWRPSFLLWPMLDALVAKKILARLGGRLRLAVSGGAALPPSAARVFVGLGLPLLQGYGMTETSPVVSCNRLDDNVPSSIGKPIPDVEVKLGDKDALLVKGPNVMLGYWHNEEATRAMFTADGWLNTGDTARIDPQGRLSITGRLKEIIVLSNGEKIPPGDMEAAIARDALFEQVIVAGEGKPFLTALVVPQQQQRAALGADRERAEAAALERINAQIKAFPGYAKVRRVALLDEPWSVENGLLTPTLKVKRAKVLERYRAEYEKLYAGH